MSVYLRPRVTGARVFFTATQAHRGGDLLLLREVALLRCAVRQTRAERPIGIDAWVLLPDHVHAIWALPAGDRAYGVRWGAIKARFTMGLRKNSAKDRRQGFSPAHPAIPDELPVVRSGRYAGLKPGIRLEKPGRGRGRAGAHAVSHPSSVR
ncbi:hypothetical protein M8756_05560 [Lutimaribacter sp. EGI FJ00015]|uniref:Uncharacterized protein n=1 Tax=Lutimaribacter degradans TaxID=2945989 RepID=A0ACC5ZTL8_9RHOB|nr:hypothetical protein [Lutimaribacter sp. EGI FJ00013]MCM2561523.1 hypothetical protein [Lutimaribacter sp. EGI FJ00013]MCO0612766.1 hypothetical protein [Lutimaribacter sp. EGI FJ00015]MCO0635424.1 hypothetical protein [Lutimaribacter sp. EGI FJ00014]